MAIGEDYANRIQASTNELIVFLQGLANMPQFRAASDKQQMIGVLSEAIKSNGRFDVINFVYPDGNALRLDGSLHNISNIAYVQKLIQTKKPLISDPLVISTTRKLSVTFAVPVFNDGQFMGLLSGIVIAGTYE